MEYIITDWISCSFYMRKRSTTICIIIFDRIGFVVQGETQPQYLVAYALLWGLESGTLLCP